MMKWTEKQREIAARLGQNQSFEDVVAAGYTQSLVSYVLNAIKKGNTPEKADAEATAKKLSAEQVQLAAEEVRKVKGGKDPSVRATKAGGELANILQPIKGAIIFKLGENEIDLNPQHLYDAYQYYKDIVEENGIEEDFSLALKDAMKLVWEGFNKIRAQGALVKITAGGKDGADRRSPEG